MQTSPAGIRLITNFEGCRLKAYRDSVGVWTIGYGDTGPDVVEGLVISAAEAESRLMARLANEFEPGVSKALGKTDVTQGQFDALVSFSYNLGLAALRKSTLLKLLKAGKVREAADEFGKWTSAGGVKLAGLIARRNAERQLFLRA